MELPIDAGTKIEGEYRGVPDSASALIITRGSKIEAVGAACNPIVFTAANGQKGGWGGLVLLGNACINQSATQYIEGIDPTTVPEGVDVTYGSTDSTYNAESSGTFANLDPFFDRPYYRGGANDKYATVGANWLSEC